MVPDRMRYNNPVIRLLYLFNTRREPVNMSTFQADKGRSRTRVGAAIALLLLLACLVVFLARYEGAPWPQSAFEQAVQKLHITQTMSRDLLASAEAEKSAVMAETDEASRTFAEQSVQASRHVEKARRELEPLLAGNRQEVQLFQEFSRCWEALQEIDREVLALAVQNTNLKALRLSFVPAAAALRRMEDALNHLMDASPASPDAVHMTRLAAQAVTGALNVYALQAPHIAESTATRMEEMEAVMASRNAQVTAALQRLQALVDEPGAPFLEAARAAYQEFQHLNAEIVDLSRQNSNVRSYALSLGQKRKTAAQCQDGLAALQAAIRQSMTYKATK
jgi:hypothetical protein